MFGLVPPSETVEGERAAKDLLWKIQNIDFMAVDTETTGLDRVRDFPVFWSMSEGSHRWCLDRAGLRVFKPFLEDLNRELIFHNVNFDRAMLLNAGIDVNRHDRKSFRCWDTMVMHTLLADDQRHGLKELTREYLDVEMTSFKKTFETTASEKDTGKVLLDWWVRDPDRVAEYASLDAWATYSLWEKFREQLRREYATHMNLLDYYLTYEQPMHDVLWYMEREGTQVDLEMLDDLIPRFEEHLARLSKELNKAAGRIFNPNSPAQVKTLFFSQNGDGNWVDKDGNPPIKMTKGGESGIRNPSTDKEVLEALRDERGNIIAGTLLEYRQWHKVLTTYLRGIHKLVDAEGRIHTSFNQHIARTGRLSCLAPWALVKTKRGEVPISKVLVGDDVWTHKQRWRKVQRQWPTGTRRIYDVRLSNGTVLTCTNNHQLLTLAGRWMSLQEIMDECVKEVGPGAGHAAGAHEYPLLAGEGLKVIGIEEINPRGSCTVYDLTVEGDHSYLSQGVFSHNSSDPNLQNIPIRTKLGRQVRKAFVCSPGKILIDSDYAQLEMRIAASVSGELVMQEAICAGRDMHCWNAHVGSGVPYEHIKAAYDKKENLKPGDLPLSSDELALCELRTNYKTVGFGVMYGETKWKLATQLGIAVEEAEELIGSFFGGLKQLKKFFDDTHRFAEDTAMAITPHGRIRRIWEAQSSNWSQMQRGLRASGNFPIQGHAAEITKGAQISLFCDDQLWEAGVRQLIQIHDEILGEVPIDLKGDKDFEDRWRWHMEHPFGADVDPLPGVPLSAGFAYGENWLEAH